jgi:hypothetical protein
MQMPLVLHAQRACARVNVSKNGAFHPSSAQFFLPDPFQMGLLCDAEFEPLNLLFYF